MIGLLTTPGSYAADFLVSSGQFRLAAVDVAGLNVPHYTCPYLLPKIRSGDAVIIVSGWLHDAARNGVDVRGEILLPLRERFHRIVGLDQADPFQLDFSDSVMELMDVVLKVNGVYKDRDLYNYIVGAPTPNGRWTEKVEIREVTYAAHDLDKIRLSVPCFLGVASGLRARVRRYYCNSMSTRLMRDLGDWFCDRLNRSPNTTRRRRYAAHFYGTLTHVQRAEAAQRFQRSSIPWKGGITGVPTFVTGLRGNGMARLTPAEQKALTERIANEGVLVPRLNRLQYQASMGDCKAVISITGYGELCFRMAEAWANRCVLVCQDLSHVETLFPLQEGRNVVYCRPDLDDLTDILDDVECNYHQYIDIAEQGHHDWLQWSRQLGQVLQQGFAGLYERGASEKCAELFRMKRGD